MDKIKVFLDDKRVPSMSHNLNKGLGQEYIDNWVVVRDYFEFTSLIDSRFNDIYLVSFDHDLACFRDGVEFTGNDSALYLINYCIDNNYKFPDFYIHTDNNRGFENIKGLILNYLKNVENKDITNIRYFHKGILNNKYV